MPVSADLVEAIARKASNTDEMIAYYLLRTLGSMGGRGAAALPILEGGVTATPSPDRFLAGVDVGQPVDIGQTLQLVMTAIRSDKPMSCDLRKPY